MYIAYLYSLAFTNWLTGPFHSIIDINFIDNNFSYRFSNEKTNEVENTIMTATTATIEQVCYHMKSAGPSAEPSDGLSADLSAGPSDEPSDS